jgi:plasmid maintenance system antidote protein VapI
MKHEMTDRSSAAEVSHPGEFIKEELEARGWTNADLAEIMGRHPNQISLTKTSLLRLPSSFRLRSVLRRSFG